MLNQADLALNNSVSERIKKAKVAFTTRRVDFIPLSKT